MKLLVLAGTTEARKLCTLLAQEPAFEVIASLAGVTRAPKPLPVPTRIGGFGGAEGLASFLRAEQIGVLIDATHPFASRISDDAFFAARETGTQLLRLERPSWPNRVGWKHYNELKQALEALPSNAKPFLATGSGSAGELAEWSGTGAVLRVAEPLDNPPPGIKIITARPPFSVTEETALFRRLEITHLITKNAGGKVGEAKLDAADTLGIKVFVIDRPDAISPINLVETPEDALNWLLAHVASRTSDDAKTT